MGINEKIVRSVLYLGKVKFTSNTEWVVEDRNFRLEE